MCFGGGLNERNENKTKSVEDEKMVLRFTSFFSLPLHYRGLGVYGKAIITHLSNLAALSRRSEIFFRLSALIFENHTCCCECHDESFISPSSLVAIKWFSLRLVFASYQLLLHEMQINN
jgi:hypothetical protein